ncbi:MAG: hypothetical protein ABF286_04985 [Polaribacter sp.]
MKQPIPYLISLSFLSLFFSVFIHAQEQPFNSDYNAYLFKANEVYELY